MITQYPEPDAWSGLYLTDLFNDDMSLKEKIDITVKEVMKMPIDGCITGSYWLDNYDPELWSCTPDVDLFVFGEGDLHEAIVFAEYTMGMTPGTGTERSEQQEREKLRMFRESGVNRKVGITTFKFNTDGVILNVTFKMARIKGKLEPLSSTYEVLRSFDMTMVMQGYDLRSHSLIDMRPNPNNNNVVYPNPLRDHHCTAWTIDKWIRQFDRVVKYYDRGYDTRPVAQFYIDMIDECLRIGSIFDSEKAQKNFEDYVPEFVEKRAAMVEWLKEHEDD